jgi:signal peptidase II
MQNRLLLMTLICLPCVGCDQLTKYQATSHLMGKPSLSFGGDVLRLEYALNPGAWGGLGSQLPDPVRKAVFTVGVGLMLVALGWYILRQAESRLSTIALSFILAGGIGNLIDRALHGHVVDFLYLGKPRNPARAVEFKMGFALSLDNVVQPTADGLYNTNAVKQWKKDIENLLKRLVKTNDISDLRICYTFYSNRLSFRFYLLYGFC